jgi:hypothetical protein
VLDALRANTVVLAPDRRQGGGKIALHVTVRNAMVRTTGLRRRRARSTTARRAVEISEADLVAWRPSPSAPAAGQAPGSLRHPPARPGCVLAPDAAAKTFADSRVRTAGKLDRVGTA